MTSKMHGLSSDYCDENGDKNRDENDDDNDDEN